MKLAGKTWIELGWIAQGRAEWRRFASTLVGAKRMSVNE